MKVFFFFLMKDQMQIYLHSRLCSYLPAANISGGHVHNVHIVDYPKCRLFMVTKNHCNMHIDINLLAF